MSTRAMVGYVLPGARWQAVWNQWDGHTQRLGSWLIAEVRRERGDLEAVYRKYIEPHPGGWSCLERGEPFQDPVGHLFGGFDGLLATCDEEANPLCFDCHYLYLLDPRRRCLHVYDVARAPMNPFGTVGFDDRGRATPAALPEV